jgi:hypothetical protein
LTLCCLGIGENLPTFIMILLTITGCSESDNDDLKYMKWFKTEEEAINYGISKRSHSALGYVSPCEFEAAYYANQRKVAT